MPPALTLKPVQHLTFVLLLETALAFPMQAKEGIAQRGEVLFKLQEKQK